MNKIISTYVLQQQVASVCVVDLNDKPYCFSCFYTFDEKETYLIFKSSLDTYHGPLLTAGVAVSGTVLPGKMNFLGIRGLQFEGNILINQSKATAHAKTLYYQQHPMALATKGSIWIVELLRLKLTDNTKGFGKKFVWQRNTSLTATDQCL